ncbi:hypothetical protein [Methylotetracoccus oryzae]|uniref:hypothetical protein n=1 Tax=Methylotetracoccus oryzae TaxID=1919059 RepID=UPI0011181A31|nr:hypothetical protein [Methylotetracoccus oryzae]
MASPSSNPFYGSAAGNTPANSGYQRLALDNLLRRELRVSDPNDPHQIANALLDRFKESPRAQAIGQEARGLPFLQALPAAVSAMPAGNSSDVELQQAKDDVERDLQELLTNSLLKDVTPEIHGWAQAIRSAIQEGTMAARFALDPRQRDKSFAIRRQLSDYARMARLVGTLTPATSMIYRKFAQSLDEVGAVILVLMGESLSNVGFNGGRFLLQVPFAELEVRRDTVIYSLRNLIGATQEAYGPNDWPRGLDGYRLLFRELENQGYGDLRALLQENELSRIMDELIERADHGRVQGLRALGSTARIDIERFRRLVVIGQQLAVDEQNQPAPWSPPLTAFLESLLLFSDSFDSSGGFRLVRVARPPVLYYGLFGNRVADAGEDRLMALIVERNRLAEGLDCWADCECGPDAVICQVILDKLLYDTDRAVDLYCNGQQSFGLPEQRASAYGLLVDVFANPRPGELGPRFEACSARQDSSLAQRVRESLNAISGNLGLRPAEFQTEFDHPQRRAAFQALLHQELCLQRQREDQSRAMLETLAPNCHSFDTIFNAVFAVIDRAVGRLNAVPQRACPAPDILLPPHPDVSLGRSSLT